MILSSILIRHFRLLSEVKLSLMPGIQLFLGLNAQGKTSLIEAVHFLSTSTSHRTNREDELIEWGEDVTYLRGTVQNHEEKIIECGLEKKRKMIKIDGQVLPRVGDLYGHLRTVLFAPEDMQIVSGSPQDRRRYLDMTIAQLDPSYILLLQNFRRALRHRNQILKRMQVNPSTEVARELEAWNQPFLSYAAQVVQRRKETVQELAPHVENYYAGLSEEGPLRFTYDIWEEVDSEEILTVLQRKLEKTRRIEVERGSTQAGPHRDDLVLELCEKNVAQFASQGQRRAVSLALRLAEAKYLHLNVGEHPLLLVDDVVYEMDNQRRSRFWQQVDLEGQLIVTATDREHLGPTLEPAQVFQVENGKIYIS